MNILDATEKFMQAGGQLIETGFEEYSSDVRVLRRKLLAEEYGEYEDKGETLNDPIETADGLLDVIVVAWGSMLAYFGPELAKKMAQSVGDSNLSKVLPDGTVLRREDGKILKPPGYMKPQIEAILREAGFIE